ncbi:MAG: YcxB family protein [Eubacteriales bacterium]|nr:YcxB family protein [Eubacteriales bacterium]
MEKFIVNMDEQHLFDFLLYHAYSKFSGFLVNILGFAVAIMGLLMYFTGKITQHQIAFFAVAAVVFLAMMPLQLKLRAKNQIKANMEFNQPVEYIFDEILGIDRVIGDETKHYSWTEIQRGVVTPKCIGLYFGSEDALILPKKDFGSAFLPVFEMTAKNLGKNHIRLN